MSVEYNPKRIASNKIHANYDWKSNNTEIEFRRDQQTSSKNEEYNPKKFKLMNYASSLDSSSRQEIFYENSVQNKNNKPKSVEAEIKNSFPSKSLNISKMKKMLEGTSSLMGNEFYEKYNDCKFI